MSLRYDCNVKAPRLLVKATGACKPGPVPKQVDHQQRRGQIAEALLRVVADRGLEAVSLRHVAAEAGVTSGTVQHYFASKEAMIEFAMQSASARYRDRMDSAVAALGDDPEPRRLVGALLTALLPLDERQEADARVGLAFQAYAARQRSAAEHLGEQSSGLRDFLADQVSIARSSSDARTGLPPMLAATALLALAEGLAVQVLSSEVTSHIALLVLNAHLDLLLGAPD